jgi:hypothetical protein
MLNARGNIRISHFDSFIVIAIVFFGLLIYNNSFRNSTEQSRKPVSTYISVSDNNAVSSTCVRLQVFQKTWISNKDNFDLLAFNRNPLSENKRTDLKISYLQNISEGILKIPQFILLYHLFPEEKDEPQHLS